MLINCTSCGRQISDRATECPKCGDPVESQAKVETIVPEVSLLHNPTAETKHSQDVGDSKRTGKLTRVALGVLAILALLLGWRHIISSNHLQQATTNSAESPEVAPVTDTTADVTPDATHEDSSSPRKSMLYSQGCNEPCLTDDVASPELSASPPTPEVPSNGIVRVTGTWRYGDASLVDSGEGHWLIIELDSLSIERHPLFKTLNGEIAVINPSHAMKLMNLIPSKFQELCAYRAEGIATLELSDITFVEGDEMGVQGDRVEAHLMNVIDFSITKPLSEECEVF